MALKAAFIFLAPEVDPQKDWQTVVTPQVELTAVAAGNQELDGLRICERWWFES